MGTSSETRHGTGTRLIYAMKITELLTFGDYSSDSRFKAKIPRYGQIEQRGDNIYHLDGNGVLRQSVPSYHSRGMNSIGHGLSDRWVLTGPWEEHEGRKAKDLNGMLVPISASGNFWYFGGSMEIPQEFHWLILGGQGMKHSYNDKKVQDFLEWLKKTAPGVHGEPFDFHKTPLIPAHLFWNTD